MKEGDICEFESHPGQQWMFTGKTTRHGCQLHGEDVQDYGLFLRKRNSTVRPWSSSFSELPLSQARKIES
jgi:hypothetical protein